MVYNGDMMNKVQEVFRNRILDYGTKPADQFEANPLNWRTHPQRQREAMRASLRELGWIGVVVENRRTGRLIDGHERVWQALASNADVPYIVVDLSEEEERLALAIFDPITGMAETDGQLLNDLLEQVNTEDDTLAELLDGLAKSAGLILPDDPNEHWRGMPQFEQEDKTSYQSIHVHFKSAEDREAFAELIGQKLTEKTNSIWYPQAEIERYADKRYVDES